MSAIEELLSIENAHRYQKLAMDYNSYRGSWEEFCKQKRLEGMPAILARLRYGLLTEPTWIWEEASRATAEAYLWGREEKS